jgi:hypothetical protein
MYILSHTIREPSTKTLSCVESDHIQLEEETIPSPWFVRNDGLGAIIVAQLTTILNCHATHERDTMPNGFRCSHRGDTKIVHVSLYASGRKGHNDESLILEPSRLG